jgi:pimeloyl-ACP methyl ester carboxylesterase
MNRTAVASVAIGVVLVGCAGLEPSTTVAVPAFEPLQQCFAELPAEVKPQVSPDCGYVTVPETRGSEDGRMLKLGVLRLKSPQGASRSPLFMLAGGPGQTAISAENLILLRPELLGQVLQDRDIVLMEQRGTRNTSVVLDCPEARAATWEAHRRGLSDQEAETYAIEVLQACVSDLKSRGVNLDAYNSVENAADVDAVRQALGYKRIIYYGASYGSQLGQHVMRDFPSSLEAVILDGANALSRKSWVEDRALDAQWGIDNLTKLCEADEACRKDYDIPALVTASLDIFAKGPLPYRYADPSDPSLEVEGVVTADDMVALIYEMQGSVIGAFSVPATLQILSQGGADKVVEVLGPVKGSRLLASRNASADSGMAFLMHAAMVCSDDPVHSSDDVVTAGTGPYATRFGLSTAREYVTLCSVVAVKELADSTDVDVSVDIPVLLLSGNLDVATPAFRSQIVANALPKATHVVFPGRTHVQLAGVNLCALDILARFTRDPAAPLDTSCVRKTPVLGFVLPDGTMSTDHDEATAERK